MIRLLVFSPREWLDPKAGAVERYVYEVFKRIAAEGHYVALVCHRYPFAAAGGKRSPRVETVDGMQVARLGPRFFYRTMMKQFLSRFARDKKLDSRFDMLVDCVNGRPLPLADYTDLPVLPIVFGLDSRIRASEAPPGPVIATSKKARTQLDEAGIAENFIVEISYGADCERFGPAGERAASPTMVAVDDSPRCLFKALSIVNGNGTALSGDLLGVKGAGAKHSGGVTIHDRRKEDKRPDLYPRAWFAYCGAGNEHAALDLAACGVPAICPDTDAGREFIQDGVTGLLFQRGCHRELAGRIESLLEDEVLRKRLGNNARKHALDRSWETVASLVLATIENM